MSSMYKKWENTSGVMKGVFLLFVIGFIMIADYFCSFALNGPANSTEEFADFGTYFGAPLSFITIALLIFFNSDNLQKSKEANTYTKEKIELDKRNVRKAEIRRLIKEAERDIDEILQFAISTSLIMNLFESCGYFESNYYKEALAGKREYVDENSMMTFKSMMNTARQISYDVEGRTDLESIKILKNSFKTFRSADRRFEHLFFGFKYYSRAWIYWVNEYSEMGVGLQELNAYFAKYRIIIEIFNELNYLDRDVYEYVRNVISMAEYKNEEEDIVFNALSLSDFEEWKTGFVKDTQSSMPEGKVFRVMFVDNNMEIEFREDVRMEGRKVIHPLKKSLI